MRHIAEAASKAVAELEVEFYGSRLADNSGLIHSGLTNSEMIHSKLIHSGLLNAVLFGSVLVGSNRDDGWELDQ